MRLKPLPREAICLQRHLIDTLRKILPSGKQTLTEIVLKRNSGKPGLTLRPVGMDVHLQNRIPGDDIIALKLSFPLSCEAGSIDYAEMLSANCLRKCLNRPSSISPSLHPIVGALA